MSFLSIHEGIKNRMYLSRNTRQHSVYRITPVQFCCINEEQIQQQKNKENTLTLIKKYSADSNLSTHQNSSYCSNGQFFDKKA